MTEAPENTAKDWAGNLRTFGLVWGLPLLATVASSFADVPARTVVWCVALVWMGSACLMNARRCGRTHCRFTGPFYLVLIVPVLLLSFGLLPLGPYGWWILGTVILLGGKIIWWATEAAWGRFSTPQ
jgi:hypothetical protein